MRPVVAAADHILDIHSTSQPVQPFWVYPDRPRNAAAALAIGEPAVHLVMPQGLGSGTPADPAWPPWHGRFPRRGPGGRMRPALPAGQRRPGHPGGAPVSGALRPDRARCTAAAAAPAQRYELLQTWVIQTPDFRFSRPLVGFETFGPGELIATDGPDALHAPADGCTVLMPARAAIVGREGVYLARPLAS